MKVLKPVDVRRAAMDLLARREHSQQELHNKLFEKFTRKPPQRHSDLEGAPSRSTVEMPVDDLNALIHQQIQRLSEENLQSDERFVESFINGRKSKGKGPRMIRQELTGRGVENELIDHYLQDNSSIWFELADKTFKKKFGEQPALNQKERAKRQRFMLHRGFLYEHFNHLLEFSPVV